MQHGHAYAGPQIILNSFKLKQDHQFCEYYQIVIAVQITAMVTISPRDYTVYEKQKTNTEKANKRETSHRGRTTLAFTLPRSALTEVYTCLSSVWWLLVPSICMRTKTAEVEHHSGQVRQTQLFLEPHPRAVGAAQQELTLAVRWVGLGQEGAKGSWGTLLLTAPLLLQVCPLIAANEV